MALSGVAGRGRSFFFGCMQWHDQNAPASVPARQVTDGESVPVGWRAWNDGAFDAESQSGKLLVVDVGIEGCTACRQMHKVTYADPGVRHLMNEHCVAVTVDADQHPELGARYEPWGWPATIFLNADGKQIAAVAGSRPPDAFREILEDMTVEKAQRPARPEGAAGTVGEAAAPLVATCSKMLKRFDQVAHDRGWGGRMVIVDSSPILLSIYQHTAETRWLKEASQLADAASSLAARNGGLLAVRHSAIAQAKVPPVKPHDANVEAARLFRGHPAELSTERSASM